MNECPHVQECLNSTLCHLCQMSGQGSRNLLRLPKVKAQKKSYRSYQRPGQKLEKDVARVARQVIRRMPASGSKWHSPGDIRIMNLLAEAKDRATITARGNQQITIHADWLTKAEGQANESGAPLWCLPFRFKQQERIYVVMDYESLISLVYAAQGE